MNRALFNIAYAALLIGPPALQAHDRAGSKPVVVKEEQPVVPTDVPPYVLKNRSKFNAPSASMRVPFWPVGWSKQKQAAVAVAAAVAEPKEVFDVKSLKLSSISIGIGTEPSLAVINERPYAEGEFLRMPKGSGGRIRVRVQRINDGSVTLEHGDQKFLVPLNRRELNQHKPEEELLDPNR
jgi:hypothetical protein